MTPEEARIMAELARKLVLFMAERRCLVTILSEAVRDKRVPTDWTSTLMKLRAIPEYQNFLAQWEPALHKLEEEANFEALLPLLQKISEGKLPN